MAPDSDTPPRVPWLPVNEGANAPTPAEPLTPTKPPVPAWIRREPVPQTVEADDDGELIAPVRPPSAAEVLPPLGVATAPTDDATEEGAQPRDAVRMLGESAVASAALSAAGAPTPLGGVPMVPANDAVQAPSFADGSPLFTPQFLGEEAASSHAADALAAGIAAHEQAELAARASILDSGAAYSPRAFDVTAPDDEAEDAGGASPEVAAAPAAAGAAAAGTAPAHAAAHAADGEPLTDPGAESGEPPEAPPAPPSKRKGKWWLWVVIALAVIAAGLTAFALLYEPEPIVNPGTVVTLSPPAPTITPIAAPTATDFQSAMPTTVGTFSLVSATPLDPTDVALGLGRLADGVELEYRSGDATMQVRALQYYTEDEAKQMFARVAGDPDVTEPVEVGGTVVGESAAITEPAPGIVWRNGTSVFVLTGTAAELAGFYEQFGL